MGIQKQKHFKESMKLIKTRFFSVVVEVIGRGGGESKLKNLLCEGYEIFSETLHGMFVINNVSPECCL